MRKDPPTVVAGNADGMCGLCGKTINDLERACRVVVGTVHSHMTPSFTPDMVIAFYHQNCWKDAAKLLGHVRSAESMPRAGGLG
ncbi:hypothetical protein E6H36_07280 [Candidatus Bathyarchaeota archaeon]|nr:MAG: hypothetical protein E6H36_07280 [Candidatus Bathyarchaeota archaeon]TMI31473.1 MAG: hypothetical protein E6H29_04505 [Candidatus Bathyarchaeota archaeon]